MPRVFFALDPLICTEVDMLGEGTESFAAEVVDEDAAQVTTALPWP